jgi:hypothetical protein
MTFFITSFCLELLVDFPIFAPAGETSARSSRTSVMSYRRIVIAFDLRVRCACELINLVHVMVGGRGYSFLFVQVPKGVTATTISGPSGWSPIAPRHPFVMCRGGAES